MTQLYQVLIALVFNVTDLTTGIMYAIKERNLKSSKLRDGLFKKSGFIICYFLAYMIDTYGYIVGFNIGIKVLNGIVLYTILTELTSIFENIHRINPDLLPDKLTELFHITNVNEKEN